MYGRHVPQEPGTGPNGSRDAARGYARRRHRRAGLVCHRTRGVRRRRIGRRCEAAPFDVWDAVAAGSLDIGMLDIPTIAIARSQGFPFSLVAAANLYVAHAPTAGLLAVAKTASAQHAKDLNGKAIGVSGVDGLPEFAVRAWIDRNGGDSDSVRFFPMTSPEMLPALTARSVDAACIDRADDPQLGKSGDGCRILGAAFTAVAPIFLSAGWFSTEDWTRNIPMRRGASRG
jgi:ABC-type taurine transport system substrate-binding protein